MRCARTEVPETLLNTQLRLDFFQRNFTKEVMQEVKKITFCGDDGDPIYTTDLIQIIKHLKTMNKDIQIVIVTNGSYKDAMWWRKLGMLMGEQDVIHFSLDGWDQKSNEQYRVGSDWESICVGIDAMIKSKAYVVWDAIAFKFNENMIHIMKEMAKNKGFDKFQLTLSTKFGSFYPRYGENDPLEPSSKLVSTTNRFQRQVTYFTNRDDYGKRDTTKYYMNTPVENGVKPLCRIGSKGLFINSRGEFYPCCWVANRYAHNDDWQGKFSLYERSLPDILQDDFWDNEFKTFKWYECQTKCKSSEVTLETASEW